MLSHSSDRRDMPCADCVEVVQLPFQTVVFESIEGKGDILMENVNTQI